MANLLLDDKSVKSPQIFARILNKPFVNTSQRRRHNYRFDVTAKRDFTDRTCPRTAESVRYETEPYNDNGSTPNGTDGYKYTGRPPYPADDDARTAETEYYEYTRDR